ncbi:MAG: sensor histidine kinase [Dichotomicrobium sp.]
MKKETPTSRSWWQRAVIPALIALAGIAVLLPVYLGQGLASPHAAAAALMVVVPGVAFGWCAWRFALRPRERFDRWRRLLPHAMAAGVFAVGWTATIYLLALPVHREAAQAFLYNGAPWQVIGGVIIYAAIAANAQWTLTRERLTEQALVATRAELQALRAQLDPHFLFNTLHTLTQLAQEDSKATEAALERFGDLMRYVLRAGRDGAAEVVLEDEIAFLRDYLALEQLRLGERLRVVEELDPEALELGVPPLLLQPLVENAVRHGIALRRDGGCLRLGAKLNEGLLVLEVADDGAGAETDAWRRADGLGLCLVRRQLEMRFPDAGRMEVSSEPGRGFAVRLLLPAHLPEGRSA